MATLGRWIRSLRPRLRGIRVVFPALLALLIITIAYRLLYGGPRRNETIAAYAESTLLLHSLSMAKTRAAHPEKTAIVSFTDRDAQTLRRAASDHYADADISEYARVLARILRDEPRIVLVSWLPHAHQGTATYLKPLLEVLAQKSPEVSVIITIPPNILLDIKEADFKKVAVVDGLGCIPDTQVYCLYKSSWKSVFSYQYLAANLWHPEEKLMATGELAESLWTNIPAYVMNLPEAESLLESSFTDVLAADNRLNFAGRIVSVGNAIVQREGDENRSRRVFTPHDRKSAGILHATPIHVFLAQLAQMFIDDRGVVVASRQQVSGLAIVFAIILLTLLLTVEPVWAVGLYVLFGASSPILNGVAISFLGFYVPVFDLLTSGQAVLVAAIFALLSAQIYQRWRSEEAHKFDVIAADIKGNFISLVSHNLNTPIARMQGILDVLTGLPSQIQCRMPEVRWLLARLQLVTRAVLVRLAIEDQGVSGPVVGVEQFQREIDTHVAGVLKRLGYSVRFTIVPLAGGSSACLRLDMRATAHAIAALVVLLGARDVTAEIRLIEEDGVPGIAVTIGCQGVPILPPWADTIDGAPALRRPGAEGIAAAVMAADELKAASFLHEILGQLLQALTRRWRGQLSVVPRVVRENSESDSGVEAGVDVAGFELTLLPGLDLSAIAGAAAGARPRQS